MNNSNHRIALNAASSLFLAILTIGMVIRVENGGGTLLIFFGLFLMLTMSAVNSYFFIRGVMDAITNKLGPGEES